MTRKGKLEKILVNINEKHKQGHGKDIRFTLRNTDFPEKFKVYKDNQKIPETFLQLALEEILTSDLVLLDAICDKDETYKNRLIQFGIAFALEKKRYFFYINENSSGEQKIESDYVNPYIIKSPGYHSFIEILNEKTDYMMSQMQVKPQKPTNVIHEAFSVIGVNESTEPDLTKIIVEFSTESSWRAKFYKPPSGTNIHEELSQQVGARTFSLFCVNSSADISVYIAIGLALGFGVPLLIIIEEGMTIPQILSGYAGVISYTVSNKTKLKNELAKYSKIFFSPEIFKTWDGFTYFYLLSKMEKRLGNSTQKLKIEEVEEIIFAITKVGRAPIVLAYILLGDVYRRRNQIFDPLNTDYLRQAISWYEQAIEIQEDNRRAIDGINATEKLIRVIDLVKDKSYETVSELASLIRSDINLQQYKYLKPFLMSEVKKMLKSKEYLYAIVLLAAMQKHDTSDDLNKLWENLNPENFMRTIQKYQESLLNVEFELEDALEKNRKIDSQLNSVYDEMDQANQITTKVDRATILYGKDFFVNFGKGWATYRPIKGLPYIKQDSKIINATEGMSIKSGDKVYDEKGNHQFSLLSEEENELLHIIKAQIHNNE